MGHEIEVKLRIEDLGALRRALRRIGARTVARGSRRVHEWNELFDTTAKDLMRRRELLRIRTEKPEAAGSQRSRRGGERVLLTFKRPVPGGQASVAVVGAGRRRHKIREELELEVGDSKTLSRIFQGMGLARWFCYEKFRTTFRLSPRERWAQGLLLELDETPIGNFLELEGPAKAIDRGAKLLGFEKTEYIVANYFSLYVADCRKRGTKPGNMVFRNENG